MNNEYLYYYMAHKTAFIDRETYGVKTEGQKIDLGRPGARTVVSLNIMRAEYNTCRLYRESLGEMLNADKLGMRDILGPKQIEKKSG